MFDFIIEYWALFASALIGAGAFWMVWSGLRTKPDDTNNRAKGGGPKWDDWR